MDELKQYNKRIFESIKHVGKMAEIGSKTKRFIRL